MLKVWPALLALVLVLAAPAAHPHGGQYQPPAAVSDDDDDDDETTATLEPPPGFGPNLTFDPSRWEWWFEFHQEDLLDLRPRAAARSGTRPWEPVTDDDRRSRAFPAFVAALREDERQHTGLSLDPSSRDMRAAAAMGLGRLRWSDAVPYLELVAEEDPDLFVRTQALLALGFTGSAQANEPLVRAVRDDALATELRAYAAAALALLDSADASDTLLSALGEEPLAGANNQLRQVLVYASGVAADERLGLALRDLFGSRLLDEDDQLRALAAVALGASTDPANLVLLRGLLTDDDNQVRRSAAAALEGTPARLDPDTLSFLRERFEAENDGPARIDLLLALGRARQPEARALLLRELSEGTQLHRPHVALALAIDGDASLAVPLREAFQAAGGLSEKAALAVALGLLGAEPDAAAVLLEEAFLTEADPATTGYLALALGLLGTDDEVVLARLESLTRESHDLELIRWSILALGLLGERARLDALAAEVGTLPGTLDRAARLYALGLVGDGALLGPVRGVADDPGQPSFVRAYALQALADLCDPRDPPPTARLSRHVELNHDIALLFELYRTL